MPSTIDDFPTQQLSRRSGSKKATTIVFVVVTPSVSTCLEALKIRRVIIKDKPCSSAVTAGSVCKLISILLFLSRNGDVESTFQTFDSQRAIQLAKLNVERDYAVVGTWEETNITLTVFEAYIPRFFKGVRISLSVGFITKGLKMFQGLLEHFWVLFAPGKILYLS